MEALQWALVSQTEQPNGYWLIELRPSDTTRSLPVNFALQQPQNEDALFLFKQTSESALFLTRSALSKSPILRPKNYQAWYFLAQIKSLYSIQQPLLITASNSAIATAFYLAQALKDDYQLTVILHTDNDINAFPFVVKPAQFMFPGIPAEAIGACPLLEDWGIPNRLCSNTFLPGCYEGDLEDLLSVWTVPEDWQHFHCNQGVLQCPPTI